MWTLETRGESKSTLMQSLAKRPRIYQKDLPKALIINADLQGALILCLSSFDSRIRGHESSESLSGSESISVSVIRRFYKEWSS